MNLAQCETQTMTSDHLCYVDLHQQQKGRAADDPWPDYLFYSCARFVSTENVLWRENRFCFCFFPFKKIKNKNIKVSDTPSLYVCDGCCADAKDKNSSESFERALWPGPPRLWCGLALKEPLVPGRVNIHMERSVWAQKGAVRPPLGGVESDLAALVTSAKKIAGIRASSAVWLARVKF